MKKYLGLLAGTLILAGCASEPNNNDGNTEEPAENAGENNSAAPEADGERVQEDYLQMGVMSDPVALDPHGANENVSNSINATIYDRLVYMDEDLEIQPGLAESLEQVEDTVWEVQVREGVTFHDGAELNAEVIQMNFERIADPDISSPVAFIFDMIEEVEVVDDYTLRLHTEFPFAPLPSHLAHPGGGIVSPNQIEASYEEMENGGSPFNLPEDGPAGTGYFQFEEYVPGEYVTLARNEEYWHEEQAKTEGVSFRVIPESLTRIGELETGGLDVVFPINPGDVERIEEAEGVELYEQNSTRMAYLGFNTEVEPFDDPLVRQAISKVINKEDLIEGVLNGTGIVAEGPLAPDVFGYSENIDTLEQDIDEAQALLAEAGYEDGFEASLLTNDDRENEDLSQLLQAQLSQIGIDVSIDMYEHGTYLEMAGQGETEMFIGSWGTVTMDADYGLYPVFHSSNHGAPGNRSFLDNPEIDELLTAGRQAAGEEERLEIYEEAQNLLAEESPYAYLYYPNIIAGISEDVSGYWQYPSSFYFLRDVELDR
ncbi:glutathione ABC transporter substrate-binding protein [Alkalicoccus daliensis]|uniref:Peptide/nickel transport system substrate-binding protein n=1 Tax=Alkalicoccus daliensis TaxID=745820 RepID=A0A1H0CV65_9BACI|nr:glutathione ABC transporter substrate-binding protein [Alkalicoccus daliensis]SDN61778.1 peptide/nickel transport system substrate-binding protein [Alkalicoccus daliensis]